MKADGQGGTKLTREQGKGWWVALAHLRCSRGGDGSKEWGKLTCPRHRFSCCRLLWTLRAPFRDTHHQTHFIHMGSTLQGCGSDGMVHTGPQAGGLNNRNLFLHRFGGQKSETEV